MLTHLILYSSSETYRKQYDQVQLSTWVHFCFISLIAIQFEQTQFRHRSYKEGTARTKFFLPFLLGIRSHFEVVFSLCETNQSVRTSIGLHYSSQGPITSRVVIQKISPTLIFLLLTFHFCHSKRVERYWLVHGRQNTCAKYCVCLQAHFA